MIRLRFVSYFHVICDYLTKHEVFQGIFHEFGEKVTHCLLHIAVVLAPVAKQMNTEELDLQRKCVQRKEEIMEKMEIDKTKEGLAEAT